jgi:mannose-6-phosphate isomerase
VGSFLLPLRGAIKNYAWGSRTFLAGLRGEATPSPGPEAELWMGAHPAAPAEVWCDGAWTSLRELIARDPAAFLGAATVERFGEEAPFLLKLLAIEQPLSLQAHPDLSQARAGFERERAAGVAVDDGNYRDPRHKPELIVALEPMWLLRGLLEPAEIQRRFAAAGIASFAGETDRLVRRGVAGLRDFLAAWLGAGGDARVRLLDEVRRAAGAARRSRPSRDAPEYWLARLVELHPGDPAVLAPLVLHLVHLAVGEGSFQPPRLLHSYLEGVGVEVMANSDNVVRAGLTPKPVDAAELLAVVDAVPAAPARLVPGPGSPAARGAARYDCDVREFELWRLESRPPAAASLEGRAAPVIAICTRGAGRIEAAARGETLELEAGGAFAARAGAGRLAITGDLDVFAASIAGEA